MINEFEQYSRLDDMEALKNFIPQWDKAPLEPFLASAQQDVVGPTWRPILEAGSPSQTNGGGGGDLPLFPCVIGVMEGGSFVPKIANVVGPVNDIP